MINRNYSFFGEEVIEFFIVGPCALESFEQVHPLVALCQKWGISYFRAHLFKPRTHPDSFQGLGEKGVELVEVIKNAGLKVVCEACSVEQLKFVQPFCDILQIGARNMQNFELLKAVGHYYQGHVLLKRGFANTVYEWISSACYLEKSGVAKENILLCERGSRNSTSPSGMTLDLGLAYQVRKDYGYSVIIDPSHGCRDSQLVLPLASAALAMRFDGLMIEVHPHPLESLSDAHQAVSVEQFDEFMRQKKLS